MTRSFREFLGAKQRESVRQLHIVQKVLEQGGFKIKDYLGERFDEPYIFVFNPNNDTSFKGVRVYKIGDKIAYRVQRESETHPYGTAYMLDLDGIFNDLMEDGAKKQELGKKVMETMVKELHAFFDESSTAEKDADNFMGDGSEGGLGMVHVRNPLGGDYSSQVHEPNGGGR